MHELELPDPLLDPEEDGMLRMSILEHLEELRLRIIRAPIVSLTLIRVASPSTFRVCSPATCW